MLQRELRDIHCPFSPASKTAAKNHKFLAADFCFLWGKGKDQDHFSKTPFTDEPKLTQQSHTLLPAQV